MLTFPTRSFVILLVFCGLVLAGVTVGVRWMLLRVEGTVYARRETDHTFEAASFRRAAQRAQADPNQLGDVAGLLSLARQHEKAAQECARIREYYETSW